MSTLLSTGLKQQAAERRGRLWLTCSGYLAAAPPAEHRWLGADELGHIPHCLHTHTHTLVFCLGLRTWRSSLTSTAGQSSLLHRQCWVKSSGSCRKYLRLLATISNHQRRCLGPASTLVTPTAHLHLALTWLVPVSIQSFRLLHKSYQMSYYSVINQTLDWFALFYK